MIHYTNPHTFKQHPSIGTEKSVKLRLSYAFADFRNIAQRAKLCKTVQNVPNSFYNFKWKTRAYLWIVENILNSLALIYTLCYVPKIGESIG